eukprot:4429097-Pyramimonas_sp.AAC.1
MLRPLALLVPCCAMASAQHRSLVRDAAPLAAHDALARTRHFSLVRATPLVCACSAEKSCGCTEK